jgi:hypothetical protein
MTEIHRNVAIRPARIFTLLMLMTSALSITNIGVQVLRYRFSQLVPTSLLNLFDLNREANIPTLFSVLLLAIATLLLSLIASNARILAQSFARHWMALAIIFGCLTVDEFVQIHELVSSLLATALQIDGVRSYYVWVLPFLGLVLIFVFAFVRFLSHLPPSFRVKFCLAGALYVGGALGVEALSAVHATAFGIQNLPHTIIYTVEEFLEMSGVILFITALLGYIEAQTPKLTFVAQYVQPASTSVGSHQKPAIERR